MSEWKFPTRQQWKAMTWDKKIEYVLDGIEEEKLKHNQHIWGLEHGHSCNTSHCIGGWLIFIDDHTRKKRKRIFPNYAQYEVERTIFNVLGIEQDRLQHLLNIYIFYNSNHNIKEYRDSLKYLTRQRT